MELHANPALSLNKRRLLAQRVVEQKWSLAETAAAAEVSDRTAGKWARRFRSEGELGLLDRSSAPARVVNRTPEERIQAITALRRLRMTGGQIAACLGVVLCRPPRRKRPPNQLEEWRTTSCPETSLASQRGNEPERALEEVALQVQRLGYEVLARLVPRGRPHRRHAGCSNKEIVEKLRRDPHQRQPRPHRESSRAVVSGHPHRRSRLGQCPCPWACPRPPPGGPPCGCGG
jgi:hypothetical protein